MGLIDVIFDKASAFGTVNWNTLFFARSNTKEALGVVFRTASEPIIYSLEEKIWTYTAASPITGERFLVMKALHPVRILSFSGAMNVYNGADPVANLMWNQNINGTGDGNTLGEIAITLASNLTWTTVSGVNLDLDQGDYLWIEITDSDIVDDAPMNVMFQVEYKYNNG